MPQRAAPRATSRAPALLPLCDATAAATPRVRRIGLHEAGSHQAGFNRAEPEDPEAEPSLQRAIQLCINDTTGQRGTSTRGPVFRG